MCASEGVGVGAKIENNIDFSKPAATFGGIIGDSHILIDAVDVQQLTDTAGCCADEITEYQFVSQIDKLNWTSLSI